MRYRFSRLAVAGAPEGSLVVPSWPLIPRKSRAISLDAQLVEQAAR
ncbi:hypothetical protein [Amycolatopsis eburnea]|nr:hypothetical protein [Amycolatopsis eburnea]